MRESMFKLTILHALYISLHFSNEVGFGIRAQLQILTPVTHGMALYKLFSFSEPLFFVYKIGNNNDVIPSQGSYEV